MAIEFKTAERKKAKLRIGISGPSGSGKTFSALRLARGLTDSWEKIFLIDTETGSGEFYSHLGAYQSYQLKEPYSPERYIEVIKAALDQGADVIVIDSTSHEWDGKGGCLEINEKLATTKFKGNSWAAWSETTPKHQKFIDAIVTANCHIITTQRSKTDTIQTEDKKIKKVGLKDIQREGFEYELTANFNLDRDSHLALASKDRTSLFIDRDPFLITEAIGEQFMQWVNSGKEDEKQKLEEATKHTKARIMHALKALKMPHSGEEAKGAILAITQLAFTPNNLEEIATRLEVVVNQNEESKQAEINKTEEPTIS